VPQALFDQLKLGGCLIAPVGAEGRQELFRYTKSEARMTAYRSAPLLCFLGLGIAAVGLRLSRLICALGLCGLLHGCADTAERETSGCMLCVRRTTLYQHRLALRLDFSRAGALEQCWTRFSHHVGQALI